MPGRLGTGGVTGFIKKTFHSLIRSCVNYLLHLLSARNLEKMAGSIPVLMGLSNITNYDKYAEGSTGATEAGDGHRWGRTSPGGKPLGRAGLRASRRGGRRQHRHLRQSLHLGKQPGFSRSKGKPDGRKLQNIKGEACRIP